MKRLDQWMICRMVGTDLKANPNFSLSLKWQLSMALIGLGMSLVASYVFLAKEIFESDKIAYVFEARQSQLEMASAKLSKELERSIQDANLILIGLDPATKMLTENAQILFNSQKTLAAIEVIDQATNEILLHAAKSESLTAPLRKPASFAEGTTFVATAIDSSRFLVSAREKDGGTHLIKTIAEIPEVLSNKSRNGVLALIENENIVGLTKDFDFPKSLIQELSQERVEKTMIRNIAGEDFLISSMNVPGSNLKLVSLDSKKSALGALNILFERSVIFMSFSGFLTVIIALLISMGLTKKLNSLTVIAGKIGQGNFSQKPQVTSNNEIGLLQAAFARMIDEIQSLLIATKEKVRMEEELKTARLVQERLFPKESVFQSGSLRISGMYDTSTECGGDWWYYFKNGEDLFIVVADATGHGAPAALNTAASRSLFANLEQNSGLSLNDLASAWDRSIAASSGQKVFMTAFMLKINVTTGKGTALNASHEPPILINSSSEAEYWDVEQNGTLGELVTTWKETSFELKPSQRLFVFTDGLWAVENKEKKTLSEARFLKKIAKLSVAQKQTEDFLKTINQTIQDHRQGTTYPDDLTLVLIDRLEV